ncbi:hypothetical protein EJ08DRAFT_650169 [Tothia fuscella]|uniref:Prolamin-like domain-containing protein n=1 Tax=Tothia fuscella TaxID=1048955 RepID=A0A9P4NQ80_9PEZI|nr:hypothetical protein EJ08DRAFT_650169 [Tothia fuscella]
MAKYFNIPLMAFMALLFCLSIISAAPVINNPITPATAFTPAFANTTTTLQTRQLGVAMDLCLDAFHGHCYVNQHYESDVCYNLNPTIATQLSSAYWGGGSTTCVFFESENCWTFNPAYIILYESCADFKMFNFNDKARSFRCDRKN